MTQEDKDLLIKDLCARLPYKTKIHLTEYSDLTGEKLPSKIKILDYCMLGRVQAYCYGFRKDEIKPYLLPLSSMTEEQYHEMQTISGKDCLEHMEVEKEWRNNSSFSHLPLYEYRVIDFFIKNHFDYRGLIPMGLAIDATGLNIY